MAAAVAVAMAPAPLAVPAPAAAVTHQPSTVVELKQMLTLEDLKEIPSMKISSRIHVRNNLLSVLSRILLSLVTGRVLPRFGVYDSGRCRQGNSRTCWTYI